MSTYNESLENSDNFRNCRWWWWLLLFGGNFYVDILFLLLNWLSIPFSYLTRLFFYQLKAFGGANLIKLWISVILLMLTPTEDNVSSNSQVIVRSAHEFYFCLSVWFFYNLFQEIVAMRRKIHFLVLPNGWLNCSFNFLHEKRKLWASLVTNANRLFAHGKFF